MILHVHNVGARHDGADSAVLLRAAWRDTRRAVLRAGGVTEFSFRQYLFACQARVLLRLGRPQEVRLVMMLAPLATSIEAFSSRFEWAIAICLVLMPLRILNIGWSQVLLGMQC